MAHGLMPSDLLAMDLFKDSLSARVGETAVRSCVSDSRVPGSRVSISSSRYEMSLKIGFWEFAKVGDKVGTVASGLNALSLGASLVCSGI